ncbi:SIMPL domain-containing protein [Hydrogenophilus thermoluteolus]|uniref:SIMPL domain-containing protein n=1 Tax=Hydrogenophilus thermoluteolus TaxID=297 RepID=UPI003F663094
MMKRNALRHATGSVLLAASLLFAQPIFAETERLHRVAFAEAVSAEVAHDRTVALLRAQAEGQDPAELADRVNRQIDAALKRANRVPGIEACTTGYHTEALRDREGALRRWVVQQQLRLVSDDNSALGRLVGALQQEGLLLVALTGTVSEAQRRKTLDTLVAQALHAFRHRAEQVTQTLGFSGYRLVRIDLDYPTAQPGVPQGVAFLAAREAAPVPITGELETLTVRVRGEVELLPQSQ